MNTAYEIIRVLRDKSEQRIATVRTLKEVDYIVETPQYVGTWLNNTRKLLRYGLGEIHVRRIVLRPTVTDHAFTEQDGQMTVLLSIRYGMGLDWVLITKDRMIGYNVTRTKALWTIYNLTQLCVYLDKDVAYVCMQLYDKLLETYNLQGAM